MLLVLCMKSKMIVVERKINLWRPLDFSPSESAAEDSVMRPPPPFEISHIDASLYLFS